VDVQVSREGDAALVTISGELDLSTSPELVNAAVMAMKEDGVHRLVVDLAGLRFIDSSGINALIEIRNESQRSNVALRLADPSPRVTEVLRLTAVDDLFDISTG
jgi:anti-sigma B factor antagonist